jgi:DNA polymerase III epsilon subunit-like protein
MDFVIVDTETTGLDPDRDRVIEIAALRLRIEGPLATAASPIVAAVDSLIGGEPASAALVAALQSADYLRKVGGKSGHGITPEMLAGSPSFDVWWAAHRWLFEGATIVAYNAPFDKAMILGMLTAGFAPLHETAHDRDPITRHLAGSYWLDLLPLVWKLSARGEKCNLAATAARYGVPLDNAHTARADVAAVDGLLLPVLRDFVETMWPGYLHGPVAPTLDVLMPYVVSAQRDLTPKREFQYTGSSQISVCDVCDRASSKAHTRVDAKSGRSWCSVTCEWWASTRPIGR